MELIIKNKSQSFEQIVIDLNVYLQSLPDWEVWQDYFKTGSGQTILDLIAALGAQLFYIINIQRQETYLATAMNRSSVLAIANMLGYSADRGNCVKAYITVTPDITQVVDKFQVIGTCKGVEIITANSVLFNEGETQQIEVIIGSLKRDHVDISTNSIQTFRMKKENISEDYRLYKTTGNYEGDDVVDVDRSLWIELPTSETALDMINDCYVLKTNHLSAVDISYLNEGSGEHKYQYSSGDVLILEYIELSNTEFEYTDLTFDYGLIESVDSVATYNPVERISSIKVKAPLAHETQAVVKARNDAKKLILLDTNNLSSVNTQDISTEVVAVSYIKNDFSLLSKIEQDELMNYLDKRRALGIQMPVIADPERILLELELEARLSNPVVKSTVTNSISDMISLLEGRFIIDSMGYPVKLDLEDIERQIEDLYGVKIARIYIKSTSYEANKYYRVGQFINPPKGAVISITNNSLMYDEAGEVVVIEGNDLEEYVIDDLFSGEDYELDGFYMLSKIIKKSGNTEPEWPTEIGATIIDNKIQWECVKYQPLEDNWKPNTEYGLYDKVYPTTPNGYMYQFKAYAGISEDIEPEIPAEGKVVTYDGELVWFQIARNASAVNWVGHKRYALGSLVNFSNDTEHSYQLIDLRTKSSLTNIEWPMSGNITIEDMVFTYYSNKDERGDYKNPLLSYNWNQYLHVDYDLTIYE